MAFVKARIFLQERWAPRIQRLIFRIRELDDDRRLSAYNLQLRAVKTRVRRWIGIPREARGAARPRGEVARRWTSFLRFWEFGLETWRSERSQSVLQILSSDCSSATSNRSVSVTEKRQSIEPVENTKRAAGIDPEEQETKNSITPNKMLFIHSLGNPAR